MSPSRNAFRGFSLTELLVAMVIGLFLLGGLVTLMVSSKTTYTEQDYNARLQENARFAMQFLSYDIRMAGFFGCSADIINDSTIVSIAAAEGGTDGTPDSVTITYGEAYSAGSEIVLTGSYEPYSAPLELTLSDIPDTWSEGQTLVISDCGSSAVSEIDTIDASANTVTVADALGRVYDPDDGTGGLITVRRLESSTYAILPSGESGIPVLIRNGQELVEGVENLQLLYQGLAGGDFVEGDSAPALLAAVQLGALVRSVANENLDDREYGTGSDITEDKGQYSVLGQDLTTVTDPIRGQRRVFSTMLAVRNRPL